MAWSSSCRACCGIVTQSNSREGPASSSEKPASRATIVRRRARYRFWPGGVCSRQLLAFEEEGESPVRRTHWPVAHTADRRRLTHDVSTSAPAGPFDPSTSSNAACRTPHAMKPYARSRVDDWTQGIHESHSVYKLGRPRSFETGNRRCWPQGSKRGSRHIGEGISLEWRGLDATPRHVSPTAR